MRSWSWPETSLNFTPISYVPASLAELEILDLITFAETDTLRFISETLINMLMIWLGLNRLRQRIKAPPALIFCVSPLMTVRLVCMITGQIIPALGCLRLSVPLIVYKINTSTLRAVQRIYRFPVGSSAALNLLFSKYQLSDAISHEKENTELAQFKEQCLCQEGGRSAGDESQLWRKFEKNDKKCKLTSITAKAYISSLNSHFWPRSPHPKVW